MKRYTFIILLIAIPLALIFLAFNSPEQAHLVRKSIFVFTIFAVPYCFFVKDPMKGLALFLLEASLLEGPWKNFTYGSNLKLLVYVIRDLLLYASFLNFFFRKRKILPPEILKQKPPHTGLIFIFICNLVMQLFNPANYNYISAVVASRMFWEMIPLYWMSFYLMREKKYFKAMFWLLLLSVFFNSIATIMQQAWGTNRVAQISEGYYVMIYEWRRIYKDVLRPPGLGPDMGFAGNYFAHVVLSIIALYCVPFTRLIRAKLINVSILTLISIVAIIGAFASMSRTSYVTSMIYLAIGAFLRRDLIRKKLVKVGIIFCLIFFMLIPYLMSIYNRASERYETVRSPRAILETITMTEKNRAFTAFYLPKRYARQYFFGNGLGKVGPAASLFSGGRSGHTNAENALNLGITEIGVFGVLIWIFFHAFILRDGFKIYRNIINIELKWLAMVLLGHMLFNITSWQFGHLIIFPRNAGFWFMSGALMGLRYIKNE